MFDDSKINFGSLPAALRKVMSDKFAEFDNYQLAKYNKGGKKKKKASHQLPNCGGGVFFFVSMPFFIFVFTISYAYNCTSRLAWGRGATVGMTVFLLEV